MRFDFKMPKFKRSEKKKDITSYLYLGACFLSAILLFLLTNSKILFLFTSFSSLSFYAYLSSDFKSGKEKEKQEEYKKTLISFYEMFLAYSALENSYLNGFKMALDALPICDLKETLNACDQNNERRFPLELIRSKNEFLLLDKIEHFMNDNEAEPSLTIQPLFAIFLEYKRELFTEKTEQKFFLVAIPILAFAFSIFYAIFFSLPS